MSSELANSGIRLVVGDCSVTECRWQCPPYQTGKTVPESESELFTGDTSKDNHSPGMKTYKHNEDGRTAPGVCCNGSVPLSHSGNVVRRNGIHTHTAVSMCQVSDQKMIFSNNDVK